VTWVLVLLLVLLQKRFLRINNLENPLFSRRFSSTFISLLEVFKPRFSVLGRSRFLILLLTFLFAQFSP